jgi:hypothetical protein
VVCGRTEGAPGAWRCQFCLDFWCWLAAAGLKCTLYNLHTTACKAGPVCGVTVSMLLVIGLYGLAPGDWAGEAAGQLLSTRTCGSFLSHGLFAAGGARGRWRCCSGLTGNMMMLMVCLLLSCVSYAKSAPYMIRTCRLTQTSSVLLTPSQIMGAPPVPSNFRATQAASQ